MKKYYQISFKNMLHDYNEYDVYEDKLAIIRLHGRLLPGFKDRSFQFKDSVSFLYTDHGTARIQVNDTVCRLTGRSIIDILDTDVVRNMSFDPQYEGILILMSLSFFYELIESVSPKVNVGFFNRMSLLCIDLTVEESKVLLQSINNLRYHMGRKQHSDYHNLIKASSLIFFLEFRNLSALHRSNGVKRRIAKEDIVIRFTHLLAENCQKQHEVRWYAHKLCLDPVYFSRLLKSINGKTAIQWIDEAVIRLSKMYLDDPDATVKGVAEALDFSDQAAFSKFFRKHVGKSPSAYQKELKQME